MSSHDMTARFGRSSLGRKVLANALLQPNPSSWMERLKTERIVENILFIDDVASLRSSSESRNLAASELEYAFKGRLPKHSIT